MVTAVSPGGAAETAGIKVGDVITAIGGADLPAGADASRALVDRMRQLEPGLKVKVAVLRDGKKQEFEVTPRAAPAMARGALPGMGPGGPGGPMPGPEIRRFEFRGPPGDFDDGTRFAGMEFATLSERLGSYFGVKSGVLVVRAGPADGPWKLQDGDVILSIDGRTPTSAAHAGRILRSYRRARRSSCACSAIVAPRTSRSPPRAVCVTSGSSARHRRKPRAEASLDAYRGRD